MRHSCGPLFVSAPPLCIEPASPSWPEELNQVEPAPTRLWLSGRTELLRPARRLAIVGSRSATTYGTDQAWCFADRLAREGLTIVSGLARGIDQAGHRATLEAGGHTLAVLASGVDCPWPEGPVARALVERGLLLSEYPPGQSPRRHHFPMRNRLIAGLACAVLVVEAAWTSGSLITARWALDQGKPVFVVPGRVDHPMARGVLRLLREGATPVASPEELLSDLFGLEPVVPGHEQRPRTAPACPLARRIDRALEGETLSADELSSHLVHSVDEILVRLIEMEIAGDVVRSPGGLWRRNPRQANSASQASITAATKPHPKT